MNTEQKKDWFPPRNKKGQIAWNDFETQDHLMAYIQSNSSVFYNQFGSLNHINLVHEGYSWLSRGIRRYYPGSWKQIRIDIGLETNEIKPKNYWSEDEILKQSVLFLAEFGQLNSHLLLKQKRGDLLNAISRNYPGRMYQLRIDVGAENSKKPPGYWSNETTEIEAQKFLNVVGSLSQRSLKFHKRLDLLNAIRNYPMGLTGLKLKLNLDASPYRPKNWTTGDIKEESELFYQGVGELNTAALKASNRNDLIYAIKSHYPGGLTALQNQVGKSARKPNGFYTIEKIESMALNFYKQYGKLTAIELCKNGHAFLQVAIVRHYPGGLRAMKEFLGIASEQRPSGYWMDRDNIENEARLIFEEYNQFNSTLLKRIKRVDLLTAILKYYPQKIVGLKRKFYSSIDESNLLTLEEANQSIERLFED